MEKRMIYLFLFILCFFSACKSETENLDNTKDDEYIELKFDFAGDFLNAKEEPLSRSSEKIYYYLNLERTEFTEGSTLWRYYGYFGYFDDLRRAVLKVPHNKAPNNIYSIRAAALIETNYPIDINKLAVIHYGEQPINIFNQFSPEIYGDWTCPIKEECPTFQDKGVDRYYVYEDSVTVNQNQVITLNLKRRSYGIQFEVDPPYDGHIEISCESPSLYCNVGTNDSHYSKSYILSYGDFSEPEETSRTITLKYQEFDVKNRLKREILKDLQIQPNIRYIISVDYKQVNENTNFRINLKEEPMKDCYITIN